MWHIEIENKPKLRTYVKFKHTLETENYVTANLCRKKRSLMAQCRIGILPLKIETGRFSRTPLEARICNLCKIEIENEIHFLCVCPIYTQIRNKLYKNACDSCNNVLTKSNEDKLVYLLNHLFKDTANFLIDAWSLRHKIVYQ